jgi:hypothetical protein
LAARSGMTILEVLIYLTLSTVITILATQLMVQVIKQVRAEGHKRTAWINLIAAHDQLCRDLQEAPSTSDRWKTRSSHCLIWQLDDENDRGWLYEENKLMRIEGHYDGTKGCWLKQSKNLVVADLPTFRCQCIGNQEILYCDCILADTYRTITNRVTFLKRRIPCNELPAVAAP